jgi:myo-inositol-1-phosphate synthase
VAGCCVSRPRVGLLFVGLRGPTASTTAASLLLMQRGLVSEQFGVTSLPAFSTLPLPRAGDFVIAGWDFTSGPLLEAIRRYRIPGFDALRDEEVDSSVICWPGLATELDIPSETAHVERVHSTSNSESVTALAIQIARFREAKDLTSVIVVYLGSPPRRTQIPLAGLTIDDVLGADARTVPAAVLYALGAIRAGAHFIDFTPSETLEMTALWSAAAESNCLLAGRDGSTGQTYLKLTLASALLRRGLALNSWYSTNVLGNHDGYVLGLDGHGVTKVDDKLSGLNELTQSTVEHLVRIECVESYGDWKESWDAVELTGFLGVPISLRLNWRSCDSLLAAPLILDLCRLVTLMSDRGKSGLCCDLGFFFKRPLGARTIDPAHQFEEMLIALDISD